MVESVLILYTPKQKDNRVASLMQVARAPVQASKTVTNTRTCTRDEVHATEEAQMPDAAPGGEENPPAALQEEEEQARLECFAWGARIIQRGH